MKGKILLVVAAILTGTVAMAQQGKNGSKKTNAPQKGYYAIGKNSEKWQAGSAAINALPATAEKGFYTLKPMHHPEAQLVNPVASKGHSFEKGYYTLKSHKINATSTPWLKNNYEDIAEDEKANAIKKEQSKTEE